VIIIPESHLDHGFTRSQIDFILERFKDRTGFFIDTILLPIDLGTVPCGLYGPSVGDEPIPEDSVQYARRPPREYVSRVVCKPLRWTRLVSVIAGPYQGKPCVLYTVFGGPVAPKELNDPNLKEEERQKSVEFWSVHALSRME
jgi:hypothetical protein